MISVDNKNKSLFTASMAVTGTAAGVGIGAGIANNKIEGALKNIGKTADEYISKAIERNIDNIDNAGLRGQKRQHAFERIVKKAEEDFVSIFKKSYSKKAKTIIGTSAAAGLAIGVGIAALILKAKKKNSVEK